MIREHSQDAMSTVTMLTKLPVHTLIIIQLDSEVLVNAPLPDLVSLLEMDCGQNLEMGEEYYSSTE